MQHSTVPGKIFSSNSTIQNYLKSVSEEQFKIDAGKIQKHLANKGSIREAVNKLKSNV